MLSYQSIAIKGSLNSTENNRYIQIGAPTPVQKDDISAKSMRYSKETFVSVLLMNKVHPSRNIIHCDCHITEWHIESVRLRLPLLHKCRYQCPVHKFIRAIYKRKQRKSSNQCPKPCVGGVRLQQPLITISLHEYYILQLLNLEMAKNKRDKL